MTRSITPQSGGCARRRTLGLSLIAACQLATGVTASEPSWQLGIEWFESKIRPVLVEQCYDCHNSVDVTEGGLAVDHREALRKGGEGGPLLQLGNPRESRLLAILR
ncbi:MAG: c-type cytochrome domain-containing protein, partial [Planctomycetota bacterium]